MNSNRVAILTDTTASIPQYLVDELNIEIVSYHVIRGAEDLRDAMDVKPIAFAEYLASLKDDAKLPTTAFPSPGEYLQGFLNLAECTREIVAVTMTSRGSGAYQSCTTAARMARQEIADIQIEIVDTLQVAMAHGWAVIEAGRAAAKNASLAQVTARAQEVARKAMMIQMSLE